MKRLIAAVNRCATQNQNFSANCEARLWELDSGTTEVVPSRRSVTARLKPCPPVGRLRHDSSRALPPGTPDSRALCECVGAAYVLNLRVLIVSLALMTRVP